jgi:hypothetical protein
VRLAQRLACLALLRPDQPGHCPGRYSFIAFHLFVVFFGGQDLLLFAKFLFVEAISAGSTFQLTLAQATPSGAALF